jgi:hypothetical protein
LNHVKDVELERLLSEIGVNNLARRLKSDRRVELWRKVAKGDAEMMAVLRVKACIVNEIHSTSDDVVCGEGWAVGLSIAGRTEGVSIVTMVAVRLLVPTLRKEGKAKRNSLLTFVTFGGVITRTD